MLDDDLRIEDLEDPPRVAGARCPWRGGFGIDGVDHEPLPDESHPPASVSPG